MNTRGKRYACREEGCVHCHTLTTRNTCHTYVKTWCVVAPYMLGEASCVRIYVAVQMIICVSVIDAAWHDHPRAPVCVCGGVCKGVCVWCVGVCFHDTTHTLFVHPHPFSHTTHPSHHHIPLAHKDTYPLHTTTHTRGTQWRIQAHTNAPTASPGVYCCNLI